MERDQTVPSAPHEALLGDTWDRASNDYFCDVSYTEGDRSCRTIH
jgi:hypothetical protein